MAGDTGIGTLGLRKTTRTYQGQGSDVVETQSRTPIIALLTGSGISLLGNLMTLVALPWYVLQTTGSPAQTGIASAFWLLPVVLAGALGGPIVDRLGHRQAIILGDLVSGVAIGAIPLLHHTLGLEFWQLLVLIFLRGLFDIPGRTARRAILPELSAQAGMPLERANASFLVIRDTGSLVGPALAGILIALIGPENVLLIDAVTYFVSACIVILAVRLPRRPKPSEGSESAGYLRELGEGFRFVRGHQLILTLLLTSTVISFLSEPLYGVVLPVFSDREFGSAVNLGIILAGFGAGSLLGTALYGVIGHRLPRRAVINGSMLAMGVPFLILVASPPFVVVAGLVALVGFISAPFSILFATLLQEQTPANMRGRVFGLDTSVGVIAMPLGVMIAGFMIETLGLRATLLAQGIAFICLGAVLLANPAMRTLGTPDRQSVE